MEEEYSCIFAESSDTVLSQVFSTGVCVSEEFSTDACAVCVLVRSTENTI